MQICGSRAARPGASFGAVLTVGSIRRRAGDMARWKAALIGITDVALSARAGMSRKRDGGRVSHANDMETIMLPVKKMTCDGPRNGIPGRSRGRPRQERPLLETRFLSSPSRIDEAALQPKLARRSADGFVNSVVSAAEACADIVRAAGSMLVSEFLAGCAAYARAMYPCCGLLEESEGSVEPEPASDQSKSDRAREARPNLRLIARPVSGSVHNVDSHRPLPLRSMLPFISDVPLASRSVQSSPAWSESIGGAKLSLGRWIGNLWAVRRAGAELRQLDDRLLRDMGVCRLDIEAAVKGEIDRG